LAGGTADLSVALTHAPQLVPAGERVTFTAEVRNAGPDPAERVAITMTTPPGTRLDSAVLPGGACLTPPRGSFGVIACPLSGALAPGSSRTLRVVALVPLATPATTLRARASVGSAANDPDSGNNTKETSAAVRAAPPRDADLSLAMSVSPVVVPPESPLTHFFRVRNDGPAASVGVVLLFPLPDTFLFLSFSAPPGWTCTTPQVGQPGTVRCTTPTLPPGESAAIRIETQSDGSSARAVVTSTATVSSGSQDPAPANDVATVLSLLHDLPLATTRLVPIVLDVETATTHFLTELALTNRGTSPAALTLTYTASLGGRLGSGTVTDFLPAGRQTRIPNVLDYLREKGLALPPVSSDAQQGGTLLVRFDGVSDGNAAAVTARTGAATAPPQPVGFANLAYAGLSSGDSASSAAYVYGLRQNSADRTNLAIFATSPTEATVVRVTVLSGAGDGRTVVVREALEIPPLGWVQLNRVLEGTDIAQGYARIERVSGTGGFSAYGIVNDNGTSDGSYVPPVLAGASGTRLTLPVLVETPTFLSELILANRGAAPVVLRLDYAESLNPELGKGGIVEVALSGGGQRIVADAVQFLRSRGAVIGPKGAASYAGAVRISVVGGSIAEVFAGARTAAQSPSAGQFGLFTPGVYAGQEAAAEAYVFGLAADESNRANVAAYNAGTDGDGAITLELQVFDGDLGGATAGSPARLELAPGRWAQVNNILQAAGAKNGWVRVRRVVGSAPWVTYGVVNDGGAPGARTGDGAFIPMVTEVR